MANHFIAVMDAANQKCTFKVVDDSGADVSGRCKIILDLALLKTLADANSDGAVVMQPTELHWLDKTTCAEYRAYFMMTTPVAV